MRLPNSAASRLTKSADEDTAEDCATFALTANVTANVSTELPARGSVFARRTTCSCMTPMEICRRRPAGFSDSSASVFHASRRPLPASDPATYPGMRSNHDTFTNS